MVLVIMVGEGDDAVNTLKYERAALTDAQFGALQALGQQWPVCPYDGIAPIEGTRRYAEHDDPTGLLTLLYNDLGLAIYRDDKSGVLLEPGEIAVAAIQVMTFS